MLEKILEHQEKRKQKKQERTPKMLEIYLIIFGIVIIFVLGSSILSDGKPIINSNKKSKTNVTSEIVNEYFAGIKDNYALDVKIKKNDNEYTYSYESDGTIKMYQISAYDILYLKYKDDYYTYNKDKTNIVKYNDNVSLEKYVDDKLYNFEFIKAIFNKCEYKHRNQNITECIIKFNDLITIYNNLYNKSYSSYDDTTSVTMLVYNSGKSITNFKMDYRLLNNFISNDTYSKYTYNIFITSVNKVEYSDANTYFPELFKK